MTHEYKYITWTAIKLWFISNKTYTLQQLSSLMHTWKRFKPSKRSIYQNDFSNDIKYLISLNCSRKCYSCLIKSGHYSLNKSYSIYIPCMYIYVPNEGNKYIYHFSLYINISFYSSTLPDVSCRISYYYISDLLAIFYHL